VQTILTEVLPAAITEQERHDSIVTIPASNTMQTRVRFNGHGRDLLLCNRLRTRPSWVTSRTRETQGSRVEQAT
jgi:hypothetical protein